MKTKYILIILTLSLLLSACYLPPKDKPSLPNPAALFCEENGYTYQIQNDFSGNESGLCVFSQDDYCESWAYYHGECEPGSNQINTESQSAITEAVPTPAENTWQDETYRLEVPYPVSWNLEVATLGSFDPPSKLLLLRKDHWLLSIHIKAIGDMTVIGGALGPGEIQEKGTISLLGQSIPVNRLQHEGKTKLSWYGTQSADLEIYARLEDVVQTDYMMVDLDPGILTETEGILERMRRTGNPLPTETDIEQVDGWVGVLVSADDMPQVDDYFQLLDQNGSRYGIHALESDLLNKLISYRDTGIMIKVWGILYRDRIDAYDTQIEIIRLEEFNN